MKKRGFTLIELMVVIAIIGLLAAIALPRFANVSDSAKVANVQGNVSTLRTSIAMHYAKNDAYPTLPSNGEKLDDVKDSTNGNNKAFTEFYGKSTMPETPGGNGSGTAINASHAVHTATETSGNSLTAAIKGGWVYRKTDGAIRASLPENMYGNDNKVKWNEF